MEAGKEGEGRKGVRIRLRFEDVSILSNLQREEGLAKCWYWIHPRVVSIAHLASDIAFAFDLLKSCPNGVSLEMGGFALPPSQPASLLQDEDLISVKQKRLLLQSRALINFGLSSEREKNVTGIQHGGLDLCAPEEFEKETGGYQSGDEGGTDPSLNVGIDIQIKDPEARLSKSKEFSSKKRKASLSNDVQLQSDMGVAATSVDAEGVKLDEGHEMRKKKSARKEKHIDDSNRAVLQQAVFKDGLVTDLKPETKERKRRKVVGVDYRGEGDSSKLQVDAKVHTKKERTGRERKDKTLHREMDNQQSVLRSNLKMGDMNIQNIQSNNVEQDKPSKEIKDIDAANGQEVVMKRKSNANGGVDGCLTEELKRINLPQEGSIVDDSKKPSRSARRKKAKRMWLREQAKNHGSALEKEQEEEYVLENKSLGFMIKAPEVRDEIEAEEERLPVMVAPGHIRFEPCDRDEENDKVRASVPVFHFSNDIRNKRQGQGWGQEKQSDKHVDKKKTFVENPQEESEPHASKERNFEGFPLLDGMPKIGDTLAYRLVELTHSWTPEISPYRVGKVSRFEGILGNVMLVPVAEYPLHEYSEDEEDDFAQQEDIYLPPYNTDGSLEVELSALMEVRMLEKGPNVSDVEAQPQTLGLTSSAPATGPEVPFENKFCESEQAPGYKLNGTVQVLSKTHSQQHNTVDVSKPAENVAEKVESVATSGRGSGRVLTGDEAWQDILCQELDRKKEELNGQLGQDGCLGNDLNCKESSAPTQIEADKIQKGLTFEGKKVVTTYRKTAFASTGHRVLRAGALGPTMALLRANQIL